MSFDPAELLRELYLADGERFFDDPPAVPLFDEPMVAVADAADGWFARFKSLIGPFHWTPQEALDLVAPGKVARSVISWCLPIAEVARVSNRTQTFLPSRHWAYTRTFGEAFLIRLRHAVEDRLRSMGHAAIAPAVDERCKVRVDEKVGFACPWSERHAAFVAGLGTFGLSGGLITMRGIAHRLGSVVTDVPLPVTARPYGDDAFAWCLATAKNTCRVCMKRCPPGAIAADVAGRDKNRCFAHGYKLVGEQGPAIFNWKGVYGCGLCQTAVPCEFVNPVR